MNAPCEQCAAAQLPHARPSHLHDIRVVEDNGSTRYTHYRCPTCGLVWAQTYDYEDNGRNWHVLVPADAEAVLQKIAQAGDAT